MSVIFIDQNFVFDILENLLVFVFEVLFVVTTFIAIKYARKNIKLKYHPVMIPIIAFVIVIVLQLFFVKEPENFVNDSTYYYKKGN